MNRVDRLLGYLIVLQSRELVRAQDLAARFEVSERTVYRDVEALLELGIPIVGVAGEGYRLMQGYSLPPVMFTEAETHALVLAIDMFRGLTKPGDTTVAASSAFEKLQAILPAQLQARVQTWQKILGFFAINHAQIDLDDERFVQLQQAIDHRQVAYLHYHAQHSNSISGREVEPLYLFMVNNTWLLHGYCRLRHDYRNFRLDRIDNLVIKPEIFEVRPTNLSKHIDENYRVIVRFDADVVRWVRETQNITYIGDVNEDEEGNVLMAYRVGNLISFTRWLLGWGAEMEVLEPADVRERVAHIAKQMAVHHA